MPEYYENGRLCSGKYLNLSFPYSNKGYFQVSKGENQECLFEGLIAIFEHNRRCARRKSGSIIPRPLSPRCSKRAKRTLTDDFIRFSEHYRFEPFSANVEAGHEKGNVGKQGGYHRRNWLVPVPRFERLSDFNQDY